MRSFLIAGVMLMATGLLSNAALGGAPENGSAKTNAPRAPALQTKAKSTNPLDAVMNDIYRREMSGEITGVEAQDIYAAAVKEWKAKDMNVLKEHLRGAGGED